MNSVSASAPLRDVQALRGRFAPVSLAVDLETLSAADRTALAKLIEAARVIDRIFLQQVWSKNLATLQALQADKSPGAEERLEYFWFNRGRGQTWIITRLLSTAFPPASRSAQLSIPKI